jgi:co-chaperonin GroES (HSP10)
VPELKPVNNILLVNIDQQPEAKIGSVYLPEPMADEKNQWHEGRVVAVPQDDSLSSFHRKVEIGDRVRFLKGSCIPYDLEGSKVLVSQQDILLISYASEDSECESLIANLEDWQEFAGDDIENWERLSNIQSFSFQVHFLEPFRSLKELAQRSYEAVAETFQDVNDIKSKQLDFTEESGQYQIFLGDDFWHFALTISESDSAISIKVNGTNLRRLHASLPLQMKCLARVLKSPEFIDIAGRDYRRVSVGSFHINQKLRILGRGFSKKKSANNALAMEKFLNFGDGKKATSLDALGFESSDLGRIDLKLGFTREVGDQHPRVFLSVEAPANDEYSLLEIKWNLQYIEPGKLIIQDYSPVLRHFLRDTVFRTFYQRWLLDDLDLRCETERN